MTTRQQKFRSRATSIGLFVALAVLALVLRHPLVIWFTGQSTGGSEGKPIAVTAGPFSIKAALDPDPPNEKGNALVLEIKDSIGKPVEDATVSVGYDMAAMGAMPEMKGGATLSHKSGGHYRAEFDLPMASNWTLQTRIQAPQGDASQAFTITVGSPGLSAGNGSNARTFGANQVVANVGSGTPGEIDHYTCSMHPSMREQAPGSCPICGMDLIPVTKEQQDQGVVTIDEARRQLIGVRTAPVVEAPMRSVFRAVGQVAYDEAALADVNIKVHGWITKLFVNRTGERVGRGQTLFTLYSPELYNAEQDFLLATASSPQAGAGSAAPEGGTRLGVLAKAARLRLRLLGMSDAQIDEILKKGAPDESVSFPSPASGFVIEKDVVEGASVDAGMRLYRIAALDKVWVEADVYEGDLSRVRVGQHAEVTLDYATGTSLLWYTAASGGTGSTSAPTPSIATAGNTTYYVSQTVTTNGVACEGARAAIVVTVNTATATLGVAPVVYCLGATTSPLSATGTSLLWYTAATGVTGTATAPTPSTATAGNTT